MADIQFLTLAEVLMIHHDQIARYGGSEGVRDLSLLMPALAQPESIFGGKYLHENIYEMAAAYAYHICQNHPFVDGNKRTALVTALVFLEINGIEVDDPEGLLYDVVVDIASGKIDKKYLADIFSKLQRKS